jgi:hypothetical protein
LSLIAFFKSGTLHIFDWNKNFVPLIYTGGPDYITERMSGITGTLKMMADEEYFENVASSKHGHHYGSLRLDMFNHFTENVSIFF